MPAVKPGPLPNLFVPGAMKSATTTLYQLLSRHPHVEGGRKEPHFFSKDSRYALGPSWYADYYEAQGERYVLDASQSYMPLAFVPERMRETLGENVRFVIVLRHPVDRMASAFKHFKVKPGGEVRRGLMDVCPPTEELQRMDLDDLLAYERRSVAEGLGRGTIVGRDETWSRHGFPFNYAYTSCYARHLRVFLGHFSHERFLFLTFEEVTRQQEATMQKVAAFLDLDPGPMVPEAVVHANTKRYRSQRVKRVMEPVKRVLKPLLSTRVRTVLGGAERALLKERVQYRFDPDVRAELTRIFAPEVQDAAALTGLDLRAWTT